MYGCKWRYEAQTKEMRDERKDKVFIGSVVDKYYVFFVTHAYSN